MTRRASRRPGTYAVTAGCAVLLLAGAALAYDGIGDDTPPQGGTGSATRYGASFQTRPGESYPQALARTDATLGGLDLVRVFYPEEPAPWPGKAPGRDVVVSFKLDPRDVVAGRYDASMRDWFATVPDGLAVHWVYWHEPEDDVEAGTFTADEYKAAFEHLDGLADEVGNPRLRSTVVLMSWSTRPASGRDWRDYLPDPDSVDVLAWDVYNRAGDRGVYSSPADLLDVPREAAESIGRPFAVAEMGSVLAGGDDGSERAAWLRDMGAYLESHDAVFAAYFDFSWNGGADDYRLRDGPSIDAWRDISR